MIITKSTHVTNALGFFSTAYSRMFRDALLAARLQPETSGPLPAPTTQMTLHIEEITSDSESEIKDHQHAHVVMCSGWSQRAWKTA